MIWSRQHHRQKKKDYVINCFVKFVKFWYNPITNICNECGAIITCNPYFSIHLSNNLLLFLLGASGFARSPNTSDSIVAQKSKGRNCPVKNGHGAGADGPAMRKQAAFGLAAGGGNPMDGLWRKFNSDVAVFQACNHRSVQRIFLLCFCPV